MTSKLATARETSDDAYTREGIVSDVVDAVCEAKRPITVGVSAPWGAGKTWVLKMIQHRLNRDHLDRVVVWLDAWEAERDGEPMVSLLAALNAKINDLVTGLAEERVGLGKRLQEGMLQVAEGATSVILKGAGALVEAIKPLQKAAIGVEPVSGIAGGMALKLSEDFIKARLLGENDPEASFKKSLTRLLEMIPLDRSGAKIVFVIDDLDRCTPRFALSLFERIRHLFQADGVAFILGYDPHYLSAAANAVYGERLDGERYFRRFIDLEVPLPDPPAATMFEVFAGRVQFDSLRESYPRHYKDIVDAVVFLISALRHRMKSRDCEQLVERVLLALRRTRLNEEQSMVIPFAVAAQFAGSRVGQPETEEYTTRGGSIENWLRATFKSFQRLSQFEQRCPAAYAALSAFVSVGFLPLETLEREKTERIVGERNAPKSLQEVLTIRFSASAIQSRQPLVSQLLAAVRFL